MKRFEQLTPANHIKNLSSEIASLKSKKKLSEPEKNIYQHLVETFHDLNVREYQYPENHPDVRKKLLDCYGHWLEYVHNQAKARAKKMLALIAGLALFGLAVAYFLVAINTPDSFSDNWESRISQLESKLGEQSKKIQSLETDKDRILASYQSLIDQMQKTREAFQIALGKKHDPR